MDLQALIVAINKHMTGGGCPTAGCIGECAAVTECLAIGSQAPFFTAHLYIWDPLFNDSALVAKWFNDAGVDCAGVSAVLHDSYNFVSNGVAEDGARPWDVDFLERPEQVPA